VIDVRGLIQTVLDTALYDDGVYVYWNKKAEATGQDPDEYVVYTLSGDSNESFADDAPLVKSASVTVRYYYRNTLLDNYASRNKVKTNENKILEALYSNGFSVPNGAFDGGDIDDIGFSTIIIECEYWRVV